MARRVLSSVLRKMFESDDETRRLAARSAAIFAVAVLFAGCGAEQASEEPEDPGGSGAQTELTESWTPAPEDTGAADPESRR